MIDVAPAGQHNEVEARTGGTMGSDLLLDHRNRVRGIIGRIESGYGDLMDGPDVGYIDNHFMNGDDNELSGQ